MTIERDSFVVPASFAQSRLWYIDQLEPGVPLYNMQSGYSIRGPLVVPVLERSVNEVIRRHEVLRTTFVAPEGQPSQVIAPDLTVPLAVVYLTGLPGAESSAVQALAREHVGRPFDLSQGPLLRVTLLRLAPEQHVLLLAMHHIVSDGWSMDIVARELSVLYNAFLQGKPSPLPELSIQYADFSQWQRSLLQGRALQDQLHFWKDQLSGAPPALDLPTDRARPTQPSYNGRRVTHPLPPSLITAAQALCAQQHATPFMVFLAAFAVVLQRHTGEDDLVIGTPIANRTHADLEGLIGLLVNTLPIRLDLSRNPTFRELLGRVREVVLNAYDHQDLPFERLVEELQPPRDLTRHPVFQVLYQLVPEPETPLCLTGAAVQRLAVESDIARLDLALYVLFGDEPPKITANYSTDLFDHATVQSFLQHYQTVLEASLATPDERIGHLPLLSAAERQQMLVAWNRTQQDYPQQCLHEMFEQQVLRSPTALAVTFEDHSLTYAELNAQANRLARQLRSLGVGPESLVGICMERSLELVVSVLGILKAGGAYVPLDPESPPDRLAFMLTDAKVRWLVTQEKLIPHLPRSASDIAMLRWDANGALTPDQPRPDHLSQAGNEGMNLDCNTSPDNLAYVVYTSGSSGRPKAVLTAHRGAVNYLSFYVDAYGLGPADIVLQLPPLSFDPAVRDLIGPLTFGGQVVMVRTDDLRDPPTLLRLINEKHITCLPSLVVTLLSSLLDAATAEGTQTESLRLILTTGEPLPADLLRKIPTVLGQQVSVVNQYGPTENTQASTFYRAVPGSADGSTVPIGRPIPNVSIHLLDPEGNPVPIGLHGEIYIGGVGISRGYLNHPDPTAAKFLPDPFSDQPGARLYRTGDLACRLPDGNLRFLGRTDHQVKVRGNRVELGEVEAVLREHPGVRQAVVMLREDRPGDARLIAYAVLHPHSTATPAQLQEHLRQLLPSYMLPSIIVLLQSLPLTSSGKVDRLALPAPSTTAAPASLSLVAPRTRAEAAIAEIWQELLDLDQVGAHDNFFDLGGHSLLAMQAISLVKKRLGLRLGPRDLMYQTLAQLAASCDQAPGERQAMSIGRPAAVIEPFYFGADEQLFGCYHHPQRHPQRPCAVVLCYPMGEEYIRFHRAVRQLAMQLTAIGFPVLRFDFYGCGDSAGQDQEWRIPQWQADLALAIAEARRRSGSPNVALAGLRLGATLATTVAAAGQDIVAAVLWDAVLDGEDHLRELQALHSSMLRRAHALPQPPGQAIPPEPELLGFRLSSAIRADIAAIDLLALAAKPAPHLLLVESNPDAGQAAFAQHLQGLGVAAKHIAFANPQLWVWEEGVGKVHVPHSILQAITSWLAGVCP
jgi:amino acid adenylation domain-containing protein